MQITWLDLIAANMAGFLWVVGVMRAWYWVRTEPKKFIPGFVLVSLIGLALIIAVPRAYYWHDLAQKNVGVIVPDLATQ